MSDLIERQDAVTLPVMPKRYRKYMSLNLDDVYEQGWEDLQMCIEHLPSAQPQRKTGKWIKVGDNSWKCNNCNEISCCSANFCPDCGAYMRGENDE